MSSAKHPGLLLALLAAALLVSSCSSYPGTGSLWVGMTREQALRAMGPAESVSAQGGFEYLNYTISISNGGYVVGRPYAIRLVDGVVESFGYAGQFSAGAAAPLPGPRGAMSSVVTDNVSVVAVEPAKLMLGATNHVRVRLRYSVQNHPEAVIHLSLNNQTPDTLNVLAKKNVPAGRGEVDLMFEVVPVDWVNRSDVKMMVSLYPVPTPSGTHSLDATEWDFSVSR